MENKTVYTSTLTPPQGISVYKWAVHILRTPQFFPEGDVDEAYFILKDFIQKHDTLNDNRSVQYER